MFPDPTVFSISLFDGDPNPSTVVHCVCVCVTVLVQLCLISKRVSDSNIDGATVRLNASTSVHILFVVL